MKAYIDFQSIVPIIERSFICGALLERPWVHSLSVIKGDSCPPVYYDRYVLSWKDLCDITRSPGRWGL